METKINEVVDAYFDCLQTADTSKLKLSPDVHYVGPMQTHNDSEGFIKGIIPIIQVPIKISVNKKAVVGNEAIVVFDFITDTPLGTTSMVGWFKEEDGLLKSLKLYFDATEMRKAVNV